MVRYGARQTGGKCGLTGARGPDDADEISLVHAERNVAERLLGLRAIGERDIVDVDDRFHGYLS